MFTALIPLFDENMSVKAYSLFTQKNNYLLNPRLTGTASNDGISNIDGLDVLLNLGIDTISNDKEVFVTVNNISVFSDIEESCGAFKDRLVLMIDNTIVPEPQYIQRLQQLKKAGFSLAIRKLEVKNFQIYAPILNLMDYMFFDYKKINMNSGRIFFSKMHPQIKLCAGNIENVDIFEKLKADGGYHFYEGPFYRTPITKGETEVTPIKANYIELLNLVNTWDFELSHAADVISRDTAMTIDLLKVVNKFSRNSKITSVRYAAAMLGQRELKRWINTVVASKLYADKPNEVTRVSLLRGKFAEELAPLFGMKDRGQEVFLMGLFSVLDVILNKSMKDALKVVHVSNEIKDALADRKGEFAVLYSFVLDYENADWQEISRIMILNDIKMSDVYNAYLNTLKWYKEFFT